MRDPFILFPWLMIIALFWALGIMTYVIVVTTH